MLNWTTCIQHAWACLPQANQQLVRMIDRRVKRLVICSSMFKSVCDDIDDPSDAHRHPSVDITV